MSIKILVGDCRERLRDLPDQSVSTCITSPPYFGLRDYGCDGQIGLEASPAEFLRAMVEVFREVRRVLRDDGTLWVNMGDSYSDKNLTGMPWRLAFALQGDAWYLRQDIIWSKPNPMPERAVDRCASSHEYIFLLSKSKKYHFDASAISEPLSASAKGRRRTFRGGGVYTSGKSFDNGAAASNDSVGNEPSVSSVRNKRSVWVVATEPCKAAHFATYPSALIEPCVLAGCPEGGTVLDPFGGSGTTALVADRLKRNAILCELNPEYVSIARGRLESDGALFTDIQIDGLIEGAA